MVSAEKKIARRQRKVPEQLVYEIMNGSPIYYRGYKSVLNNTKKIEDIMGSSSLQSILLTYIMSIIIKSFNEEEFWLMTNEAGIHLDHKNNLAADLMLYEKTRLQPSDIKNRYANKPPNVVIEVDTKADFSSIDFQEYLKLKTTKLHEFGVDRVIWILTTSKQVVVALAKVDWLLVDWNKDVEIWNGVSFNIGSYVKKNNIELEEAL